MIISDARGVAQIALGLVLLGCSDYPRENPFDPAVTVSLRIEGQKTLTAVGESVQLSLVTDPPYPHEAPVWHATTVYGTAQVTIDQTGRLTIASDPSLPDAWTRGARQDIEVTAELGGGRRHATTIVTFMHAVAGLHADDCEGNKTITLDSLHRTSPLCASYVDPLGVLFQRTPVDPLYATARSSGIVATPENYSFPYPGHANYSLERRGVGSTWVVLRTSYEIGPGTAFDSVFVTVTDTLFPR